MKKNWIVWKRTIFASICELICPVALLAILAITRTLVDRETIAVTSNISKSTLIIPPINYTAGNVTAQMNLQQSQLTNFTSFSSLNYTTAQPLLRFLPLHCAEYSKRNFDQSTVIAYSGKSSITGPIIRDLESLCKHPLILTNINL